MSAFPSIAAPQLRETSARPGIKSQFESGYAQTRARTTRTLHRWHLTWELLTDADYATLKAFFTDTAMAQAVAFTWTHPLTSVAYTVRFAADELEAAPVYPNHWQAEIDIEEV